MKKGMKFCKKLAALMLCLTLFVTNSNVALADIGLAGEGSATGTSPSEFEVSDDLGGGATVRLPANLNLDFTAELDSYQTTANVGVYGNIKDYAEIAISINEELIYSDGVLNESLSTFSRALPTLDTGDEEYPYYYRVRRISSTNSTGGNGCYSQGDFVLKSKGILFYAKTGTETYGKVAYNLFGYDGNGNVGQISNFYKTDEAGQSSTYFYVGGAGSKATGVFDTGYVKVVSGSVKNINKTDNTTHSIIELNEGDNLGTWAGITAYDYSPGTDSSSTGITTFCDTYGYQQIEFSGLVFDSANDGRQFFMYDADDYNHVTGKVRFGENANGVCTEVWNAEECAVGYYTDGEGEQQIDLSQIDNRVIMVNVPSYEVAVPGTYYATAEFDINFTCVGMRADISAATKTSEREIEVSDYSYAWDEDYTSTATAVNLAKLSNKPFTLTTTTLGNNASFQNIKYLQLADNTTTNYLTYIDDTDPANCKSWILGMKGLQVLVIPKSVTPEQLHKTAGSDRTITVDTILTDNNSVTAVFDETTKKIGNAMCFVKNIDANGKWIYVPHICFRGTKEEFKALSGFDNWIFGNAGNIVTVHCSDGIMYY